MKNSYVSRKPSSDEMETNLSAAITKSASKQTYYTFLFLVQRRHLKNAFRAYAYFRWVDDMLDCNTGTQQEKIAFLTHQQELLDACYRKESPSCVSFEEQMLVNMIRDDQEENSGIQIYLRNMMAVMSFDVHRKGLLITQAELAQYSHLLSVAVTELLFHLLSENDPSPRTEDRYQAVHGAHIAHMLRDMREDINLGYINVPADVLRTSQNNLIDLHDPVVRNWVMERVKIAHHCFNTGKQYFSQVKSVRCRLAAAAYLARFEWMLWAIERDDFYLRHKYPERKSLRASIWMAWRVLVSLLSIPG